MHCQHKQQRIILCGTTTFDLFYYRCILIEEKQISDVKMVSGVNSHARKWNIHRFAQSQIQKQASLSSLCFRHKLMNWILEIWNAIDNYYHQYSYCSINCLGIRFLLLLLLLSIFIVFVLVRFAYEVVRCWQTDYYFATIKVYAYVCSCLCLYTGGGLWLSNLINH